MDLILVSFANRETLILVNNKNCNIFVTENKSLTMTKNL